MTERFSAVVFDAGGVLVLPTHEVIGPLIERFGGEGSEQRVHRAHYAAMRAQDAHSTEEQDWLVYRRAFLATAGVGVDEIGAAAAALLELWLADPDLWRWPLADAVTALRRLNDLNIPIAVVSNAEGQIEATLARTNVCQVGEGPGARVEVVIDSHVVGVAKPSPGIFAFALDVLGIPASRVLYIGDSVTKDVVGARNAGLHPLHLDPYDDHPDADHDRITTLHDVLEWLT